MIASAWGIVVQLQEDAFKRIKIFPMFTCALTAASLALRNDHQNHDSYANVDDGGNCGGNDKDDGSRWQRLGWRLDDVAVMISDGVHGKLGRRYQYNGGDNDKDDVHDKY